MSKCQVRKSTERVTYNYWFPKFFREYFFSENRNKIVKNQQNTIKLTAPKWQDFELFKTHWFLEFEQILLWYFSRKQQTIPQNIHFFKKCYFYGYFLFLIGFTHTNNLSQVLLSWLFTKFLCDVYTHCIPTHLYLPVCS